ncbi:hypothetical protein [Arthrospiribacter ruber]|uniref:Uncharacterized protein n=1 Tax=Arthrospiribacter ruber TaxID=2487934 RepID=A0A951M6Y2_9BACT|nr:hypothetical protein [Arthrospiribacter ruber]MBW3466646.1 hypothetical protein [Arthrospiribacter ruber]
MGVFLVIGGIALAYFGFKKKSAFGQKPVGQMSMNEVQNAGCSGYFKMMMIVGGIGLALVGLIFMAMDSWM